VQISYALNIIHSNEKNAKIYEVCNSQQCISGSPGFPSHHHIKSEAPCGRIPLGETCYHDTRIFNGMDACPGQIPYIVRVKFYIYVFTHKSQQMLLINLQNPKIKYFQKFFYLTWVTKTNLGGTIHI